MGDVMDDGSGASPWRRVLLKISGEALMGDGAFGIDPETVRRFAKAVIAARTGGVELCLVIGGGNIFRGVSDSAQGMPRADADYMGMLATVMNALAMKGALEAMGAEARVMSAIPMDVVCEPYNRTVALSHLRERRIVIFAAGVGSPYFTTDTGAALRAIETGCDVLLKGTQVDGVYDSDPRKNPDAKRFETVSYGRVLSDDLKVMDATAIALARENRLPVVVFNLHEQDGLASVLSGRGKFTIVQGEQA